MIRSLKRILLVEDDPDIQVVGQLALEAVGGFTVVTVNETTRTTAIMRSHIQYLESLCGIVSFA